MLKLYELRSSKMEFRLLTHINLNPVDRCVHFIQFQDIFIVTYESGQAEYIRF